MSKSKSGMLIALVVGVSLAVGLWMRACNKIEQRDPLKNRVPPVVVTMECQECDEVNDYSSAELDEIFNTHDMTSDANNEYTLPCKHCGKFAVRQVIRPRNPEDR